MLGFSFAYVSLDAGLGALILFGGVQVTMFAGGLWAGERPAARRWIGAGVALAGLVWLMWPGGGVAPDPAGAGLMAAAAVGWGIYSLAGRAAARPLASTAANFLYALPAALLVLIWLPSAGPVTVRGVGLAVLSGAVTSGLGYALWYSVLPRLQASAAAVAQLTVPVIAMAGGMALLDEVVTLPLAAAAAVVLGGVALSLSRPRGR
jgi:drug/metabolite transporter (DMT)-like permease